MGRASRRKQKRSRAAAPPLARVSGTRLEQRRRWRRLNPLAMVAVATIVIGTGTWLLQPGVERPPNSNDSPQQPRIDLPDPDTSGMTAPVARAIGEARRDALARPDSAAAVGRLGEVLHAHWLLDDAARCYEMARKLAPEEFRWTYLLAGVEEIRGADGARIEHLFREAIRLAPQYAPVYARYADALMRLGRWSEARDTYAAAVELDPELILAHRGLGQAATLLGQAEAAVEHLERAASLSPEDRIVHVALARAYSLADRSDQAAEATRKARALTSQATLPDQIFFEVQRRAVDPETLRGRVARGLREGNYDAAIEAVTLLEESGDPAARQQLALASKQRANQLAFAGEFDLALAAFEQAARLARADPEIEHNWGTVLLRRGNLAEARRHFEKAIKLNPRSADSLYNLGVVLEGLGRTDEAIERFTAAAAIEPRHPAANRLTELGVVPDR